MEKRKKIVSFIALLLCVLMVIGVAAPILTSLAYGTNTVTGLKDDLATLDKKQADLKKQMGEIANDISAVTAKKEKLDAQINVTNQEIDALDKLIVEISTEIAVKEQELIEATAQAQEQYEMLRKRIRANYEQGNISYIELLLSSDSYSDFLTNMDTVEAIIAYDNKLYDELTALKDKIAQTKLELETDKTEQETAKGKVEAKKTQLTAQLVESGNLIASLKSNEAEAEKQMAAYEREEERINANIDKMIREAEEAARRAQAAAGKPQVGTQYTGGAFQWPCASGTTITSNFGNRTHPVTGKTGSFHRGIDIAAPNGTGILAGAGGTVITAGYNSSYGNYVVINHGGGVTSLYAHSSRLLVSAGQQVSKGQKIALIGSTGSSTGNHLHFEVRVNGAYQSPLGYLKG